MCVRCLYIIEQLNNNAVEIIDFFFLFENVYLYVYEIGINLKFFIEINFEKKYVV